MITPNHVYAGSNKIDLTQDTNTVYTHPSSKVCAGGDAGTLNGKTAAQIVSEASKNFTAEKVAGISLGGGKCRVTFSHYPKFIIVTSHATQGGVIWSCVATLLPTTTGEIMLGGNGSGNYSLYMRNVSWSGLIMNYELVYFSLTASNPTASYVRNPDEDFIGIS